MIRSAKYFIHLDGKNVKCNITNLSGYVPKYRCVVNECENISTASYYEKHVLPFGNWDDKDLTFSSFVESAIGQLNPNTTLERISKTCKRILPSNLNLQSPTHNKSFGDTCIALQSEIDKTLQNG